MRFDQILEHLRDAVKESGSEKLAHITTVRKVSVSELSALLDDYDRIDTEYRKLVGELDAYADEIGAPRSGNLSVLIKSHRHLRKQNMKSHIERVEELQRIREQVAQETRDATWVKLEDLRGLTPADLVQMLGEAD